MRHDRFQNHISESIFTLPICAVLATLLWWWPLGKYRLDYALGWVLCAICTYIILETNNSNFLIRIRTRMVSCVWLVLFTSLGFLHPISKASIAASCLVVSHFLLFKTYQQKNSVGWIFHSFLFLSLGSLVFPQMFALAVFYYWYLIVLLRAISWRNFFAGIIGLLLPYWFWTAFCALTDDIGPMVNHILNITEWHPISLENYLHLPQCWIASWTVITLTTLIGGCHFLTTYYNDNIKQRMLLYIYVTQTIVIQIFLLVQPQHFQTMIALLAVSGSPLIAHYFVLTSSWISNTFFCFTLLLFVALAVWNLWMPTFTF